MLFSTVPNLPRQPEHVILGRFLHALLEGDLLQVPVEAHRLDLELSGKVLPERSWFLVARGAEFQKDLDGIVDIPRSIKGTQVGLLFRLTKSGQVKISFRSNGPVDVNLLARRFQGGGHVKASGAVVSGPIERAVERVLSATREAVARTGKARELE